MRIKKSRSRPQRICQCHRSRIWDIFSGLTVCDSRPQTASSHPSISPRHSVLTTNIYVQREGHPGPCATTARMAAGPATPAAKSREPPGVYDAKGVCPRTRHFCCRRPMPCKKKAKSRPRVYIFRDCRRQAFRLLGCMHDLENGREKIKLRAMHQA